MAELEEQRSKLRNKIKEKENNKKAAIRQSKNFNPDKLKAGDSVFVTTLNQKATVISISPNKKEALVQIGIMKSKVSFDSIDLYTEELTTHEDKEIIHPSGKKYTAAKGNKDVGRTSVRKASGVKTEIDLRGTMTSEALEIVDKYLDDAYLAHLTRVSIIHGKGTGALRQSIHQFLRTSPHIKSYRLGEYGEGDSGVTIVEFNE
jgi:DNA mismatch repair protein MutS2